MHGKSITPVYFANLLKIPPCNFAKLFIGVQPKNVLLDDFQWLNWKGMNALLFNKVQRNQPFSPPFFWLA